MKHQCRECSSTDIRYNDKKEFYYCADCGERYSEGAYQSLPQVDSKNDVDRPPLKIFLSYGHDQGEICEIIYRELKARGFDVWIDQAEIKEGKDWRLKITEGIESSNGVLSCLSEHSVRNPGVCLDELSIAVGIKGGNIHTILLEDEKSVQPPASIAHLQWLDMSDWQHMKSKGEADFERWLQVKMNLLADILNSPDYRNFEGEITEIRKKLPQASVHTSKQEALLQKPFVGRKWLTEQVEKWLTDENGARLCVLFGDPGIGKSAFAANYIHYNPKVAAGIFCEYNQPHFNNPVAVIQTLAFLLACRLPSYRRQLAVILDRTSNLYQWATEEQFVHLLCEPHLIDGGHEPLCIVIDGLDECGTAEQNVLAESLFRFAERLPKWLRILVTSRRVASVRSLFKDTPCFELNGDDPENRQDVRIYFEETLREDYQDDANWAPALDALTEKSQGIFLYAVLMADTILKKKITLSDYNAFPDGLDAAFGLWFKQIFPDLEGYKKDYRLPIGTLMAFPEPLPTEELGVIFGWDENEIRDFVRKFDVLLRKGTNVFGKETIQFAHKYIEEWLTTADSVYYSGIDAARKKMGKAWLKQYEQDGIDRLSEYAVFYFLNAVNVEKLSKDLLETKMHEGACKIQKIGDSLNENQKIDNAEKWYRKGAEICKKLADGFPSIENQRAYLIFYGCLGDMAKSRHDFSNAIAYYKRILKWLDTHHSDKKRDEDQRMLLTVYERLGDVSRMCDNQEKMEYYYDKAYKYSTILIKNSPTPENLRQHSVNCERLGNLQRERGCLDEAVFYYRETLRIRLALAKKNHL